jgi:hypothetical protein
MHERSDRQGEGLGYIQVSLHGRMLLLLLSPSSSTWKRTERYGSGGAAIFACIKPRRIRSWRMRPRLGCEGCQKLARNVSITVSTTTSRHLARFVSCCRLRGFSQRPSPCRLRLLVRHSAFGGVPLRRILLTALYYHKKSCGFPCVCPNVCWMVISFLQLTVLGSACAALRAGRCSRSSP